MKTSFEDFQEAYSNYSDVPARNPETWRAVLEFLDEWGWTPCEYLDWVFREYRKPLVPKLLLSETVASGYDSWRCQERLLADKRMRWLARQAQTRIADGQRPQDILGDPELATFALFRYMFAKLSGLDDEAEKLREAAVYECKVQPWLPEIYCKVFDRGDLPC